MNKHNATSYVICVCHVIPVSPLLLWRRYHVLLVRLPSVNIECVALLAISYHTHIYIYIHIKNCTWYQVLVTINICIILKRDTCSLATSVHSILYTLVFTLHILK